MHYMNENIPTLLKLQELEGKRYDFQMTLNTQAAQAKKLKEPWVDIKVSIDEKKMRVKKMKVEQNQIELDIETRVQTVARLEEQRFETSKNDDFAMMGDEINNYKDDIEELENTLLCKLETIEQIEEKLADELTFATELKPQLEKELGLFKQKLETAKKEVVELESAIAHLGKKLPSDTLEMWHRLSKSKAGIKTVVLFNEVTNVCPSCNMNVPAQVKIDIAHDENLVTCPSCSSFLYLEDDTSCD